MSPIICLDHGPDARPACFRRLRALHVAWSPGEVADVLDRAEAARRAGAWIAGYIAYEAGYAFEPRLSAIPHHDPRAPLVALGVFDTPDPAAAFHAQAEAQQASLSPILPRTTRREYALIKLQFGARGMDLHHLFTDPAFRGLGVGCCLVDACKVEAVSLSCRYLTVSSQPENHEAQAFYSSLGFERKTAHPQRFSIRLDP